MGSRREEERNEKIIRGLMKLPPNRKCINCNSVGPQYVCTNFWTFVCLTCSGIHREFTHRVKSVSMAKFTSPEVEALQRGGNQRAREIYLKDWDMQGMRLPNNSNPDNIRDFIRSVYVNRKYAGSGSSEKPPTDVESLKNNNNDQRRPSSYHSFSQSPPYDFQYEDRRYGRQAGMLTRRTGSERVYDGKITSIIYSPDGLRGQMNEDGFANESTGSRFSDFSASSTGDPFRYDAQSPSSQDTGYYSPAHQRKDALEHLPSQSINRFSNTASQMSVDGIQHLQRTASSGSIGSIGSSSISRRSIDSGGGPADAMLERPPHHSGFQQVARSSLAPSAHSFAQPRGSLQSRSQELLSKANVQPTVASTHQSIDLFAGFNDQTTSVASHAQTTLAAPLSESEGWATFDLPHHTVEAPGLKMQFHALVPPSVGKGTIESATQIPVKNTATPEPVILMNSQIGGGDIKKPMYQETCQSWNAFDHSSGNMPSNVFGSLTHNDEPQVLLPESSTSSDPYAGLVTSKHLVNGGMEEPSLEGMFAGFNLAPGNMMGSSIPASLQPTLEVASLPKKSTNPFDLPYESELEANSMFMNTNPSQAAFLGLQTRVDFPSSLAQPWFPRNPAATYIPSMHHPGGLPYIAGQAPNAQTPNLPPQGPFPPIGQNPFA